MMKAEHIQAILKAGHCTLGEGLALFDALPAASTEMMIGAWAGSGLASDHPMDGLLETYGWHGKVFDDAETVHPLIFKTRSGRRVRLGPRRMFSGLALNRFPRFARSGFMRAVLGLSVWLLTTRRSRARLRLTDYRGKTTATMQYDHLPINDVFARIDDDTVLGVMDMKGLERPFFFLLRREPAAE